jgi:hypothetical protein
LWPAVVDCDKKNPTTDASRGFLSKSCSASTSPGDIAAYDDRDYQNLLNVFHYLSHGSDGIEDGQD